MTTEDLSIGSTSGKVHFLAVSRELLKLGHQVTILSPRYGSGEISLPDKLFGLHYWVPGKNALGLFWFEVWLAFVAAWIKLRYRPDVLLVRGGGPGWIPGLFFYVFRLWGIPVVLECNGITWTEFAQRGFSRLATKLVYFSAWQQAVSANRLIGVTSEIADAYAKLGRRCPSKSYAISNGTYPEQFNFSKQKRLASRQRLGISDGALVVGYVGAFSRWHGVTQIAQAAKELQEGSGQENVLFLLVGSGNSWNDVDDLRKTLHLENIRLTGQSVDREELRDLVACFDVGLCTYTSIHGSSLKLFEYMAAGIPILASGFPEVLRIVKEHEVGIVLDSPTPQAITDSIRTILHDREHWQNVGLRGREVVAQNYSWSHTARHVERVLLDARGIETSRH